jgi:hypothetical protein
VPFFESTPTVFPPVIPPCGPLGDVPAFAFAVGDAVVAWTPPDDFASRSADVNLSCRRVPPPGHESHSLAIKLLRRGSNENEPARHQIERDILYSYRKLGPTMRAIAALPENRFTLDIEVDEVTQPGPSEIQWRYIGHAMDKGKLRPVCQQGVGVVIRDDGSTALGFTLIERLRPEPADPYSVSISTARGYVESAFTERVEWTSGGRTYLWTHDVGIGIAAEWTVFGTGYGGPAEGTFYEYRETDGRFMGAANVSVMRPEPLAGLDILAENALELKFHRGYETEVSDGSIPAHGHVLAGGFEVRRLPKAKHRPEDADDDPEFPDEWEPEPGELVRVAFVVVGRHHVSCVRLAVGDNLADRFEGWWQATLERLHVPCVAEPRSPSPDSETI